MKTIFVESKVKDIFGTPIIPGDILLIADDYELKPVVVDYKGTFGSSRSQCIKLDESSLSKMDAKKVEELKKESNIEKRLAIGKYDNFMSRVKRALSKINGEYNKYSNGRGDYNISISCKTKEDMDNAVEYFNSKGFKAVPEEHVVDTTPRRWELSGYVETGPKSSKTYYYTYIKVEDNFPELDPDIILFPKTVDYRAEVLKVLDSGNVEKAWEMFLDQPEKKHFTWIYRPDYKGRTDIITYDFIFDVIEVDRHTTETVEDIAEHLDGLDDNSEYHTVRDPNAKDYTQRLQITKLIIDQWKADMIRDNFGSCVIDW